MSREDLVDKWSQLLGGNSDNDDIKTEDKDDGDRGNVIATLKVEFTDKGKMIGDLDYTEKYSKNMNKMSKAADEVVDFFTKKVPVRATKWLSDLGADDEVIKHALIKYIEISARLLAMEKKDREEVGLKPRNN